ncbi:MAG: DegV family protein [Candidatus Heimdallarchaeota archaeon]|nr:DegV family protein [Candidatus Heimdallarchaeota archaeon]
MRKVKIVSDSTCDLPEDVAKELGIIIVPLKVFMDEEVFTSGVDLCSEEFYSKLPFLKDTPTTNPPSPAYFYSAYEDAANEVEKIISIHISRLMSETIIAAEQARNMLPHMDIRVYDSKTTGASLGLILIQAANAANEGKTIEEVCIIVEDAIEKTRVVGFPSTLKYLIKGGRIGRARGLVGRLFGMIPILSVYEGETSSLATVQGKDAAIDWIINYLNKEGIDCNSLLALTHGNMLDTANQFKMKLTQIFQCRLLFIGLIGPVVGAHLGPGSLYFAYMKK